MNTISSVYYGWGFFIFCGGAGYWYAKRAVSADREQRRRFDVERRRKLAIELEKDRERRETLKAKGIDLNRREDDQKSEFEASVPYRAPKGDRFS